MRGRTRAEAFARALDGEPTSDATTLQLVGVAARLSTLPVEIPSTALRASGRAAIVGAAGLALAEAARHGATTHAAAAAATHTASHTASQGAGLLQVAAHGWLASTALAVATGVTAVAVGAGAVGVAAHRSIPGDPFYGLKRTAESARLDLARGAADKGRVRLDESRARLAEIEQLWPSSASGAHSTQIASLVDALDRDVALATGPLLTARADAELSDAVDTLQTALAALPRTLTGPGAAAVTASITLLGRLTSTVTALPVLVPGTGPIGVAPTAPTLGVQVAPSGSAGVLPAPTASTAPPGGVTVRPNPVTAPPVGTSSLPQVLPSVPSVLPSQPAVVPSALPSAVSSAVCGLLGVLGTVCPTGS